jgi:hypothetical protein
MSLLDDPTEWLKSSLIATSPNLDLIVFAFVQNFVILGRATTAQKYDILSRVHIAQDGQAKNICWLKENVCYF